MTNAELIIKCSTVPAIDCGNGKCPYKMDCTTFKRANECGTSPEHLGPFIKQLRPDWLMADIDMIWSV